MLAKGFMIVEWMIQFLLCTLIALIAFSLFRTWTVRLNLLHARMNGALQMPAAYDVMRQDVLATDPDTLEVAAESCLCHAAGQYVRWRFKHDKLVRTQKKYDAALKTWRKAVTNVAAEQLQGYSFAPLYEQHGAHGTIKGVAIMHAGVPVYVIGLRNGKII